MVDTGMRNVDTSVKRFGYFIPQGETHKKGSQLANICKRNKVYNVWYDH